MPNQDLLTELLEKRERALYRVVLETKFYLTSYKRSASLRTLREVIADYEEITDKITAIQREASGE